MTLDIVDAGASEATDASDGGGAMATRWMLIVPGASTAPVVVDAGADAPADGG